MEQMCPHKKLIGTSKLDYCNNVKAQTSAKDSKREWREGSRERESKYE